MVNPIPIIIAIGAAGWALLYRPIDHRLTVFGTKRSADSFDSVHGTTALHHIPNTIHCEDLHHHVASNTLFTACQPDIHGRISWFPPLGHFDDPLLAGKGSLNIIDAETLQATKLELDGFDGPFVSHGIDIYSSPTAPEDVYIFAINHLPNPAHYEERVSNDKARSQVEVFLHKIGSGRTRHLRSVQHPLIATPNDLLALSPTSFFVTNDHYYRDGPGRALEDLGTESWAAWSTIIHVDFSSEPETRSPTAGLVATKALNELHNNNGIGRGDPAQPSDVLIVDASGGKLTRASITAPSASNKLTKGACPGLAVRDSLQLPSTLDNPSYFVDAWAAPGDNATGPVLAGLGRAWDLAGAAVTPDKPIPVMVWHVRAAHADAEGFGHAGDVLEKRLVFQDDGRTVRSASAAVMVGLDPAKTGGRKQARLFVTGFLSEAVVVTTVDL